MFCGSCIWAFYVWRTAFLFIYSLPNICSMAKKIISIDLTRLANGTHIEFLTACCQFYSSVVYKDARFQIAYQRLQQALEAENQAFRLFDVNEDLPAIYAAHRNRYACYLCLKTCVYSHAHCLFSPHREVAGNLREVLRKYPFIVRMKLDEMSGRMRSLVDEIKGSAVFLNLLAALGLTAVFEQMEEASREVSVKQRARDELDTLRGRGRMRQARRAADAAYADLMFLLQSLAALVGEPYLAAIHSWNVTVERYKLNAKLRKAQVDARENREKE